MHFTATAEALQRIGEAARAQAPDTDWCALDIAFHRSMDTSRAFAIGKADFESAVTGGYSAFSMSGRRIMDRLSEDRIPIPNIKDH